MTILTMRTTMTAKVTAKTITKSWWTFFIPPSYTTTSSPCWCSCFLTLWGAIGKSIRKNLYDGIIGRLGVVKVTCYVPRPWSVGPPLRCLEDGGWGRTGTLWDLQDYKAVLWWSLPDKHHQIFLNNWLCSPGRSQVGFCHDIRQISD